MKDYNELIWLLEQIEDESYDLYFNSSEQLKIFIEEERSFQNYCLEINYDEKDFQKDWCDRTKWRIEQRIRGTAKRMKIDIPNDNFFWHTPIIDNKYVQIPEILDHNFILSNQNNYWELMRSLNWRGHKIDVAELAYFLRDISFDPNFLLNNSKERNINIKNLDDYKNIYKALVGIPLLNIYENSFISYIKKTSSLFNLPYIGTFQQLNEGLDAFVDIMLATIDKKNSSGEFDLYRTSEINQLLAMKEFKYSFFMIIHCIIGKLAVMKTLRSNKTSFAYWYPEAEIELHSTKIAAKEFISYHELGHFILGHFEKKYNKEFEFEADAFAISSIEKTSSWLPGIFTWKLKGIFIALSAMDIIEKVRGIKLVDYPSTIERIKMIKNKFSHYYLDDLIETISDVINPMVDEYLKNKIFFANANEIKNIFYQGLS